MPTPRLRLLGEEIPDILSKSKCKTMILLSIGPSPTTTIGVKKFKDTSTKHPKKIRLAYSLQSHSLKVVFHAMWSSLPMDGSTLLILLITSAASVPKVLVASLMTGWKITVPMKESRLLRDDQLLIGPSKVSIWITTTQLWINSCQCDSLRSRRATQNLGLSIWILIIVVLSIQVYSLPPVLTYVWEHAEFWLARQMARIYLPHDWIRKNNFNKI